MSQPSSPAKCAGLQNQYKYPKGSTRSTAAVQWISIIPACSTLTSRMHFPLGFTVIFFYFLSLYSRFSLHQCSCWALPLPSLTISLLSRSSLITALFALHVRSNCCALKAAWAGILSQIHRTAAAFSRSACFHNPSDLLLLSVPLSITALTNALFVPVSFHSLDVCIAICVLPHCSPQHGLLIEKKIVFFLSLLQTVPLSWRDKTSGGVFCAVWTTSSRAKTTFLLLFGCEQEIFYTEAVRTLEVAEFIGGPRALWARGTWPMAEVGEVPSHPSTLWFCDAVVCLYSRSCSCCFGEQEVSQPHWPEPSSVHGTPWQLCILLCHLHVAAALTWSWASCFGFVHLVAFLPTQCLLLTINANGFLWVELSECWGMLTSQPVGSAGGKSTAKCWGKVLIFKATHIRNSPVQDETDVNWPSDFIVANRNNKKIIKILLDMSRATSGRLPVLLTTLISFMKQISISATVIPAQHTKKMIKHEKQSVAFQLPLCCISSWDYNGTSAGLDDSNTPEAARPQLLAGLIELPCSHVLSKTQPLFVLQNRSL